MKKIQQQKVFVGLSGGVDSSVTAALLKEQGYDVTGVFIRIWNPEWGECGWKEDRRDAMQVALALDIPFETVDLSAEYYDGVAKYMIEEYKAGRTPNPDVMCNSVVKFGAFLEWAKKQGADYVATGHYARISPPKAGPPWEDNDEFPNLSRQSLSRRTLPATHSGRVPYQETLPKQCVTLLKGMDNDKDQTYFLWQLTQEQLRHALFPVGEYQKSEVRELARKFKLPTAEKKDSQGLCFIGKVAMKEFLQKYIEPQRGDVLNERGEVIGYHDGAMFLTLGQRRGFTVTAKTPDDAPYYIVAKDVERNIVTVAHEKKGSGRDDSAKQLRIGGVNWISGEPEPGTQYQARFRYRQPLQACMLKPEEGGAWAVIFDEAQEPAAPGQSVVAYDGEACIGGGVII